MGTVSCGDKDGGSGPGTGNGFGIVGRWSQETFSKDYYFCRILTFDEDGTHTDKIQRSNEWEECRGRYEYEAESSELRIRYERQPAVCNTYHAQTTGNTLYITDLSGRTEAYSRMK